MKNLRFNFYRAGESPPKNCGDVVHMPQGITDKRSLLHLFAARLSFPKYFGSNWDALDESLSDLSWLKTSLVCIWHKDIPLAANPDEARRYLLVLDNVLSNPGSVQLRASFPETAKADLMALVSGHAET